MEQRQEGLTLRIAGSKTDQEGKGQTVAIPRVADFDYCPVQAVLDWVVVAEIDSGPLFCRMHRGDTLAGCARSGGLSRWRRTSRVVPSHCSPKSRFVRAAGRTPRPALGGSSPRLQRAGGGNQLLACEGEPRLEHHVACVRRLLAFQRVDCTSCALASASFHSC